MVNGIRSEYLFVSSGVPQGSVLGPLLFLLYLNSLLVSLKQKSSTIKTFAFADDVKLFGNDCKDMQMCLHIIERWSRDWQLPVQPEKSEHIRFFPRDDVDTPTFYFDGISIKQSKLVKDLGVLFSDNLSWMSHIRTLKSKAERTSYTILRTFKSRDHCVYVSAFNTYVRPQIEYNTSVWSPFKKAEIVMIESIQRTFSKKVCQRLNLSFNNYLDRLRILKITSLEYRRLEFDLILLFKILNGNIFVKLDDELSYNDLGEKYNLRRNSYQIKSRSGFKTDIRLKFFITRTIKVWNKLPQLIVESQSPSIFKNRLHKFDLHDICELIF